MCRMVDGLRWIQRGGWAAFLIFLLGGCSGGMHTPLLHLDMAIPSRPAAERELPVLYPDDQGPFQPADDAPLLEAYGPAWRDVHDLYPEYQFN